MLEKISKLNEVAKLERLIVIQEQIISHYEKRLQQMELELLLTKECESEVDNG